jgi:hypothetical protein
MANWKRRESVAKREFYDCLPRPSGSPRRTKQLTLIRIETAGSREYQIVVDYEVYYQRPSDSDLLIAAIEIQQVKLGRTSPLVAADAGLFFAKNEAAAKARGVKRVCIPNRSTKSAERKREQKKRWFRNGQKRRTGCEGSISGVQRRHGLVRCTYKNLAGMNRWVGLHCQPPRTFIAAEHPSQRRWR